VGATTISYLGFGCIITIVFKKEKASLVLVANNALALILLKYHQCRWGRRLNGFPANICIMFFRYLRKVDYAIDKIIHATTFNYNEVMHLLKLAGCGGIRVREVFEALVANCR